MHPRARSDSPPHPTRLTLYCLPNAGGGTAHYNRWRPALPGVEIVPLELPGHGGRLAEPPARDLDALVDQLAGVVDSRPPGPFALLGHSFGALVAYELALRPRADAPAALIVCGRDAPGGPARTPVHTLPDEEFIARLRRLGGIPDEVARHPELLRLYLPALRADLEMAAAHRGPAGRMLGIPVTAFGTRDDTLTTPNGLAAWARATTGPFSLTLLPGTHFFLHEPGFLTGLRARLDRLMGAGAH
ncbi:alpha/beta fold hydrolase [Sphaerisporangium sp. TRM90804]|uniref:thioesterase II family protein n=1 Tax=Sphaerisporangium sp. TRM90804 TaxID=3031113 RepID=UPI00244D2228|nr:alpha/beta fold hydrolase [Sphaerisporangium sp. TRM90804]MDH2427298.1 alpha/beta fold hydrolase [Sphaerisporangium sp. TRM90804]